MSSNIAKMRAARLAWETADAYSADIWGAVMWTQCAEMLLDMDFTEPQVRAILRSKITRWSRDSWGYRSTWLAMVAKHSLEARTEIQRGDYGDGGIGDHALKAQKSKKDAAE
jgi:hypothetical protein